MIFSQSTKTPIILKDLLKLIVFKKQIKMAWLLTLRRLLRVRVLNILNFIMVNWKKVTRSSLENMKIRFSKMTSSVRKI